MRRVLLIGSLAALAACDAATLPTEPVATPPEAPSREFYHAPTWGTQGFTFSFWSLPAVVPVNAFDGGLQPTVEICRLTNGACGPVLATFTRTSGSYGQLVTVDAAEELYTVSWPTGSTGAQAGQTYRVSVRVGTRPLGYADVQMASSLFGFFAIDREEFVPWVAGLTLPISFRIEAGIPGSITLSASSIAVNVGESATLTAQVRDLRGNPLAVPAEWWIRTSSSVDGGQVVQVDSGWVIGTEAGTGLITAWIEDVETTIPVTVTDARRAWTSVATPDDQGIRAMWGTGGAPAFAAGHAGMLRNAGGWQYVDAVRWRAMNDVLGFGANDVWAAGDDGTLLRFDGTGWTARRFDGTTVQPLSLGEWGVPARRVHLRALHGTSATQLVAAGDSGTLLRLNGTTWSVIPTGTTAAITDVWGTSVTNLFLTTDDGRVLRYNGTAVTVASGIQAPGALRAVWGSSGSNVYVVGDGGALYRFNGSTWTRTRLPTRNVLYAAWGTGTANVFVGGEGGVIYRWDGTRWTPERSAGGTRQVFGFWGTTGDVYAVGGGGLVTRR